MSSGSNRQKEAKDSLQFRSDVSRLRVNFRKEFMNRLKSIRNDQVDRLRQICERKLDCDYRSLLDLQKIFQPDKEAMELFNSTEVMDLLKQVENEIRELEAEEYEKQLNSETEAMVENLMNSCSICDRLIVEGNLCQACSESHFNSNF